MRTRRLLQSDAAAAPYLIWNAFIEVLALEDYETLSPEQRPAHLVFWYESEVMNGGHLQYFENRGTVHLEETIESLGLLGANTQQQVLREAAEVWKSGDRQPIETVEEYCESALEGEFANFDARFDASSPTLQACLEAHLKKHRSNYVEFE